MNAWDEVMQQPYYTAETLNTVANGIEAYMNTGQPKNESLSNFFIAAAHASDVCEYIRDKRKPDFDLLPYENDEADIDEERENGKDQTGAGEESRAGSGSADL